MSDWRYHVASLSAVLLGIGVGLLIGGLYLSPTVPDQIAAQLRRLDEQLAARTAELRQAETERENLKQALARADSLFARMLPEIAARQLQGRRVALLVTTDERSVVQGVERLISEAGAELLSITRIEWALVLPDERTLIFSNLPELFKPGMSGNARAVLGRRQGVRLSGDYSRTADTLVWIGGYTADDAREEWLQFDSELIAALQSGSRHASSEGDSARSLALVACEPFVARLSIISLCKAADVPSVDCVDMALGKGILLALLQGETGNYGLKPSAESTFPNTLIQRLR